MLEMLNTAKYNIELEELALECEEKMNKIHNNNSSSTKCTSKLRKLIQQVALPSKFLKTRVLAQQTELFTVGLIRAFLIMNPDPNVPYVEGYVHAFC